MENEQWSGFDGCTGSPSGREAMQLKKRHKTAEPRSAVASAVAVVAATVVSLRLLDQITTVRASEASTAVDSREFCLHESFRAICRFGKAGLNQTTVATAAATTTTASNTSVASVILMMSAVYGRMRLGRCLNGDYNIGCSKDVLHYFDSQCTSKQSCDVSIRNLVDLHPCQRDFMSYLEATYKCIEVSGLGMATCPLEGRLQLDSRSGYFSAGLGVHRSSVGSESCPWVITVKPGQRIHIKVILLNDEGSSPMKAEDPVQCSSVLVVRDNLSTGTRELGICSGKLRERHLYTSTGHEVILFLSRTTGKDFRLMEHREHPRFILSYEAAGCPDLIVPSNAWIKRVGDNVMIKCNETMETWYFTCQRSQWIGDIGNCSHKGVQRLKNDELKDDHLFPAHGIVLAVLIGILLGMFVGMILLLAIHCARRRSKRVLKKRQALFLASHSSGPNSEGAANLKLPDFHRSSRPRDDRYPALLMGAEKVSDVEKLYDFSATSTLTASTFYREGGRGARGAVGRGALGYSGGLGVDEAKFYCPKLTMVGGYVPVEDHTDSVYAPAGPGPGPATDDDRCVYHSNRILSSHIQPCRLCVQRNCECLRDEAGLRLADKSVDFHDSGAAVSGGGSGGYVDDSDDRFSANTSSGLTIATSVRTSDPGDQKTPSSGDSRESLALEQHHHAETGSGATTDFNRTIGSNCAGVSNRIANRAASASKTFENT